jgi:NAD(P)-dependent dehydrogenase (short-subunit alcohol dehydrogenase family)
MAELDGNIAIVTGGAGALGSAVVAELLAAGAAVFVPVHAAAELDRLRGELGSPARLDGAALDLTDEAAVEAAYADVAARYGGIDLLANIAGGFAGGAPVAETPWSLWQHMLDLNLKTAVLSCKAAVPHIVARGGGAIVNVGTRTVTQPGARVAAYGAAKRAVIGLTEALAAELRKENVTVNAILPSVIDTPANRANEPGADYSRWVKPAEIARVIRFLVGPDARIISGASIPVYGRA